jgi:hypothetical protein
MGIFLGDKPVSVFFNGAAAGLPVQGVFLGGIQVFPTGTAAATLYFDGDVDSAWTTVGNWWLDAGHTQPAGRLPTSADSVVASANITASGQTVVDFTLTSGSLSGTLTVTGMATFNGEAGIGSSGTVTGNATFNDDSGTDGTVTGNATFNNNSFNSGTVSGDATFNDSSFNFGTVTGDATFNDSSGNFSTVTGDATFNDSSFNDGTVDGTVTCNTTGSCP